MQPKWVSEKELTPRHRKRAANKQERKCADKNGGMTVAGSGSGIEKLDVNLTDVKIKVECKRTDKKSLSIKKEWLTKVRDTRRMGNEVVFELEIQDEDWYLIPETLWKQFLGYLRDNNT